MQQTVLCAQDPLHLTIRRRPATCCDRVHLARCKGQPPHICNGLGLDVLQKFAMTGSISTQSIVYWRRVRQSPSRFLAFLLRWYKDETHLVEQRITVSPILAKGSHEQLVRSHQPPLLHCRIEGIPQIAMERMHGCCGCCQLHISVGLSLQHLIIPLLQPLWCSEKLTILIIYPRPSE